MKKNEEDLTDIEMLEQQGRSTAHFFDPKETLGEDSELQDMIKNHRSQTSIAQNTTQQAFIDQANAALDEMNSLIYTDLLKYITGMEKIQIMCISSIIKMLKNTLKTINLNLVRNKC